MIKKDELITMNDGEYFVLETLIYDSIEYGFANKIDENEFEKKIINVKIRIEGSKNFETENDYVLKYW